jgi:hypothetical protein
MSHKNDDRKSGVPPIGKRWRPGVSGNPRGRPKKVESLTSLLQEEIGKICPADREKRTWKELIVLATLQLAIKGNATALREVWERLDGKTLQAGSLQVDGTQNGKVEITVVYENSKENQDESGTVTVGDVSSNVGQ